VANDDEIEQDDPYADYFDEPSQPRFSATDEIMFLHLDVRAREVALEKAVDLHRQSNHDIETTAQQTLFTARAFYEFLTGESDPDQPDSAEQAQ